MTVQSKDKFLKSALTANAVFSGLSGVMMILFGERLNSILGVEISWLLLSIGIGLIGFSGYLFFVKSQKVVPATTAWAIVAADIMWVAGSLVVLVNPPSNMEPTGKTLVAGAALIVAIFAALQSHGTKIQTRI